MGRLLLSLPIAAVICFALFAMMAWMVDNGHKRAAEREESLAFSMVMVEEEEAVKRRQRSVPEPPKLPEPPPQEPVTQSQPNVANVDIQTAVPDVAVDFAVTGLAISVPAIKAPTVAPAKVAPVTDLKPINNVKPKYPAKAKKRRVEGYVKVQFDIDATGRPQNIKIIEAKPKRYFERATIQAVKRWKYNPTIVNGVAVPVKGHVTTVEFDLAQ